MKKFVISGIMTVLLIPGLLAQEGKIRGKIIDASSNEPLPFANIIIEGTQIGSISDLDGSFLFTGLEPGFVRLRASFIGYKTALSSEYLVTNAKTAYVEIKIEPSGTELEELVVKASPFEKPVEAPVSMQRIGLSEIENNPGSNRDISRVIQSYPGVGAVPSFRNDIIIRGGGPSENVFYLDEIEIPVINHFSTQGASGGAVGILNADFLRSVNYYSGSFPANRGNALSSVFEFEQTNGNQEKLKSRFSVGASEMSLTVDGPAGKNTDYIISARRSYLQFLFDALGLPFLPTFTDYQLKVRTKISPKHEFRLVSIGALDEFRLNLDIENPDEEQEYILTYIPVNEQWNYAIGGVYKHFGKNNFQTLVLSRNMLNNVAYKYPENDESRPKLFDYASQEIENKFRFEHTILRNDLKIRFSINGAYVKYTNTTNQLVFINDFAQQVDYSTFLEFYKAGGSAQVSNSFMNKRLFVTAGIRTDVNTYSKSMGNVWDQLSPRISLKYNVFENIAATVSLGKYYSLPAYTTLGYRDNSGALVNKENDVTYIGGMHYVAGMEYNPSRYATFSVEGFYKVYRNYPFSVIDSISLATRGADFGVIGDEEIVSTGEGRAAGFELLHRSRIADKMNLTVAYTFVRSEFRDKNGIYVPTGWDSKHILTSTSTLTLKKNWSVGAKWRFVGRLPYTPYDLEKSVNKDAWDTRGRPFLDYDHINSERFKPFHQLDVRVDKRYFFNKWSLMFYVDIQNFYNYQVEQQDYMVREKDETGEYIVTDDNEYILKRISNSSGTVLPTIGIMVEL